MMSELIHHTDESADGGVSPFDSTIREVTDDEDVLIACPYITLDYLESVLREADSWRLLTDTEAWLDNYAMDQREAIRDFIARNHDRIHDIRNLHAKAVIGETSALVGSANLTRMGVGKRDELAVRLDEPDRIAELREWFDDLWKEGSPANLDDIDDRIRTSSPVPSSASGGGGTSISSSARRVNASLELRKEPERSFTDVVEPSDDAHERLLEEIEKAPTRGWIHDHFELLEKLIHETELAEDDPRIVTSITEDGKLNTTINSRLVLGIQPKTNKTTFILGHDAEGVDELNTQAAESWRFAGPDSESAPHLFKFIDGLERIAHSQFKRDWMSATIDEINHGEHSPYRRHHKSVVYQAAVDHEYRERILDEAFGT